MKQLCLSVIVELPPDLFRASELIWKLDPTWTTLLASLQDAKVEHTANSEILDVRTKATRRPRKPRLVPAPEAA
jgi:hypothetical protein